MSELESTILDVISRNRTTIRALLADQIPLPAQPGPPEESPLPTAAELAARRAEEERVAREMNSTGILTPWHLYR